MYGLNELQKIQEYEKKIETFIAKKAKISGDASPAGSTVKKLIEQRNALENEVNASSEIIKADKIWIGFIQSRMD